MLAGMDQVAGPKLAAAVTAAGGFGTVGGARYTPKMLREMLAELKEELKARNCENAPFGVDLLLPQVGGSARKTNVRIMACGSCNDVERGDPVSIMTCEADFCSTTIRTAHSASSSTL
jgi:NAD(P)H-dependent flavin oxidoreductase YrpB (nitropropane dioxygenase family)